MKDSLSAASSAASVTLQGALETATSVADTESIDERIEVNGDVDQKPAEAKKSKKESRSKSKKSASASTADEKVKTKAETASDAYDETETTQTIVSMEKPTSLSDLPAPSDTEDMIAQAKKIVEEATKQHQTESPGSPPSTTTNKKRKTDALDEEDEVEDSSTHQPAKKAKVLTDKLRRERIRNRALVGVTATLAIAAAIPYFF